MIDIISYDGGRTIPRSRRIDLKIILHVQFRIDGVVRL